MSSSETAAEDVEIRVRAGPGTEIFLIDSSFNLRARGIGDLNERVIPGLYKVKFKEGSLIREVHQAVEAGRGPVDVPSPSMDFSSPVPIAKTSTTGVDHEEAAERLSRTVHRRIAPGSQIFVFARVWTGERDKAGAQPVVAPMQGLTLHDLGGELLVDLEHEVVAEGAIDPSSGCTVEVMPGTYRLRVQTERWGALEQAVVASSGWQTQVFLWQTDDDGGRVPDLAGAAVFLSPMGAGFSPAAEDVRATEVARMALLDHRTVMPLRQLERVLASHARNPMAGIYAAHALVAGGAPDHDLLLNAVEALASVVGEHPDVEALRIFSGAGTTYRYVAPPMLSSSWSVVVAASAELPELIPVGSLAARASTRLWGDGPWLLWMGEDGGDGVKRRAAPASLEVVLSRIADIASTLEPDELGLPRVAADLSDVEEALLSVVAPQPARRSALPRPELRIPTGGTGPQPSPSSVEGNLAARLGVPPSTIVDVAESLLAKLEGGAGGLGGGAPSP